MANKIDSIDRTFLIFVGVVMSVVVIAVLCLNIAFSIISYNNRQIQCTAMENGYIQVNGNWVKSNEISK